MGIEYIRILQGISAPVLLAVGLLLLAWVITAPAASSHVSCPSRFTKLQRFLKFLIPALNGTVAFGRQFLLNIPDFTRFARKPTRTNHRPGTGAADDHDPLCLIGIAVTSATVVIYGTAISDPVQLLSRFHSPVAVVISLIAILLATLNVNIEPT